MNAWKEISRHRQHIRDRSTANRRWTEDTLKQPDSGHAKPMKRCAIDFEVVETLGTQIQSWRAHRVVPQWAKTSIPPRGQIPWTAE